MTKFYSHLVSQGRRLLLTSCAVLGMLLLFATPSNAQSNTYSFDKAPLNTVMSQISAKTSYQFIFDADLVKRAKSITLKVNSTDIRVIMDAIVKGQDFSYEISDNKTIILTSLKKSAVEEYEIHGMVTDSTGMSLPGASVRVKNGRSVTTTDANGHFTINVTSANNTLQVNYIGYLETERSFEKSASTGVVTIKVMSNSSLLDEVVVNGFQSVSKERSTAAVAIVDNKKLNENVNVDLLSALEGRVAGLAYVKNVNGIGVADQPLLRGQGTYSITNVGTAPLVVIDGLPTETALENVNPYDIESVTVLKDAAASSIYGSRSANGVIVLTTKKGSGPVKVTLNTDFFVDTKPGFSSMHYASPGDILNYETDVYNQERARYTTTESMFAAYGTAANGTIKYYSPLYQLYRDRDAGKVTADQVTQQLSDWSDNDYYEQYRDNVWRNAFRQRYNLSISSATSKSNTFTSINYDNSAQRTINNKDDKLTLYFKNTYNVTNWLTTTIGVNGAYTNSVSTDASYNSYDVIQPRYASIVNADGSLNYADYVNLSSGAGTTAAVNGALVDALSGNSNYRSYNFNILQSLQEGQIKSNIMALRAFANIQAKITKGLNFSSQFQYENNTTKSNQFYDADSYKVRIAYNALTGYTPATGVYTRGMPAGGQYGSTMSQNNSYTFRNQLSFDRSFGSDGKHSITAIAGFEMRQTMIPIGMSELRYGYDPVTLTSVALNNATLSQSGAPSYIYGGTKTLGFVALSQDEIKHRFLSRYANAGYTYMNRYNITGSVRIDQADLFGVDPKYKNRPLWSAGLGWNISNEDFMQKVKVVNLLKLRATYGINGNVDQSGTPLITARRRTDNLFPTLQYTDIVTLPNPKLRWEQTATINAGLDYALLSNRLRGSIDVYSKKSTDLLVTTELDQTVGTASRVLNSGALRNKGIEFSVGGDWLKNDGLTLSSQFIIGFNKNEIGKVNNTQSTAQNYVASPTNYLIEGNALNTLYAYRYGGMINGYPYFLDENGKASLEFDADGNPLVSSVKTVNNFAGLVKMGTLVPTYTGSFSQRIAYKQFELGALLVFSGGNVMRKDVLNLSSNELTDQDITLRYKNGVTPSTPRLLVDYPQTMISSASTISTMWRNADVNVIKADYIKLRNVSFSYNLPQQLVRKIHVSSAKLTAQVNNLWYASAAGDDIDPESYSVNSGTRTLQNPKSFVFGFNLTF